MRGNFSDAKGPEKTMCIKGTSGEPADRPGPPPAPGQAQGVSCFTTGDDARDDRRSFFFGTDSVLVRQWAYEAVPFRICVCAALAPLRAL